MAAQMELYSAVSSVDWKVALMEVLLAEHLVAQMDSESVEY